MRGVVTTAMEVAGMMIFAVSAGAFAGFTLVGVALAGLVLAVAGVVEGRR